MVKIVDEHVFFDKQKSQPSSDGPGFASRCL